MELKKNKQIIESIMFAVSREIKPKELATVLELTPNEVEEIIENMKQEYEIEERGIQIIKVNDGYQMCSIKENYDYIYPIIDKRNKPNLSQAALETLSIIAYNPNITRAEIETIRGVNSDGTIYKLLDYNLIEEAGRTDAPGRPMTYKTSNQFLKLFGYQSLDDLPELPRYKVDENQQIVIDDIVDKVEINDEVNINQKNDISVPERETEPENKVNES